MAGRPIVEAHLSYVSRWLKQAEPMGFHPPLASAKKKKNQDKNVKKMGTKWNIGSKMAARHPYRVLCSLAEVKVEVFVVSKQCFFSFYVWNNGSYIFVK